MSAGLGLDRADTSPTSQAKNESGRPSLKPGQCRAGRRGPDGLHHAGLEHRGAGTNRHTANGNQSPKKHVVQTDAFPSSTATAK
ncbi:MAG: hypothetical protein DM484_24985 [Candidatus Methylumidiphilus alinenensis]|uniref:Uncharacterized protein n=1 Tax=Candidatus Methylumidiphilus alinenensis TaxID=2202197 RepID=A0A2W4QJ44_9GAMM|nr:MAG: hypothetical protein DM484_24985 [Candidatus Methylumidiphilus alinenensis]